MYISNCSPNYLNIRLLFLNSQWHRRHKQRFPPPGHMGPRWRKLGSGSRKQTERGARSERFGSFLQTSLPIGSTKFPRRFPRLCNHPSAGYSVNGVGRLVQAGSAIAAQLGPGSHPIEIVAFDEREPGRFRRGQLGWTYPARESVRHFRRLRIEKLEPGDVVLERGPSGAGVDYSAPARCPRFEILFLLYLSFS